MLFHRWIVEFYLEVLNLFFFFFSDYFTFFPSHQSFKDIFVFLMWKGGGEKDFKEISCFQVKEYLDGCIQSQNCSANEESIAWWGGGLEKRGDKRWYWNESSSILNDNLTRESMLSCVLLLLLSLTALLIYHTTPSLLSCRVSGEKSTDSCYFFSCCF